MVKISNFNFMPNYPSLAIHYWIHISNDNGIEKVIVCRIFNIQKDIFCLKWIMKMVITFACCALLCTEKYWSIFFFKEMSDTVHCRYPRDKGLQMNSSGFYAEWQFFNKCQESSIDHDFKLAWTSRRVLLLEGLINITLIKTRQILHCF